MGALVVNSKEVLGKTLHARSLDNVVELTTTDHRQKRKNRCKHEDFGYASVTNTTKGFHSISSSSQ